MRRMLQLSVLVFSLGASGCASFHSTTQGFIAGGLFGAAIGAGVVAATSGNVWTGAAIGGAAGAVLGGYVGCMDEGKCR